MSSKTRQQQKADTRAALKRAARLRFEGAGYRDTNVADIARSAGVAHGTFYVHFANKDAVLDELLVEFNEAFAQRLAPVFARAAAAPVARTVRATAEVFLDYWDENRRFVECYAQRSAAGVELTSVRDGINPPMARMIGAALNAAAAARGGIAPSLDLVTHALLAMWLRVGLQYLFGEDVSRARAIETLASVTVGAIEAVLPEASR